MSSETVTMNSKIKLHNGVMMPLFGLGKISVALYLI